MHAQLKLTSSAHESIQNRKKSIRIRKPDEKPDGKPETGRKTGRGDQAPFARHARNAVRKLLHASHSAGSSGSVPPRAFASATLTLCRALRSLRNFPGVRLSGGFRP